MALETLTLAMSGKYVAKATNCQTKHVYTRSVQLDVIPLPEPTPAAEKEPINACSIFGDPHIVTFDKHTLHFAGLFWKFITNFVTITTKLSKLCDKSFNQSSKEV